MPELRPYQSDAIANLREQIRAGSKRNVLVAPTGCHAAGHLILMANGSRKPVEEVSVGDQVMGPDSHPRTVKRLHEGQDTMFRIHPSKGTPFDVNGDHFLALRRTNDGSSMAGQRQVVSVREWVGSRPTFRHVTKLERAPVSFCGGGQLPIDPYMLGVLIGDGGLKGSVAVTTPDPEIVDDVYRLAGNHGVRVRKETMVNNASCNYYLVTARNDHNPIRDALYDLGLLGCGSREKRIPYDYMVAGRGQRLEILAGLIDTDGYLGNGCFEFSTVSEHLADGVLFLARSLGFGACCSWREVPGYPDRYARVSITGHIDQIPNRVSRKQAAPRKQVKNVLVSGFSVEELGVGDYYGFEIDGDHLYLDGAFTVHHNSGKTVMGSSIIESAVAKGSHALFIAHRRELVHQASRTFTAFGISHGILMAGEKPRLDRQLQVASVDTLKRRLDDGVIAPPRGDLVMIDEAHRSISDKYAGLIRDRYPDSALVGLTATPVRGDGTGLGVLYDGMVESESMANLIQTGYLVQPRYYAPSTPDLKGVQTQDGDYVQTQLADAVDQPALVGDVVENWSRLAKGRRTIVFATSVAHSRHLADAFHDVGVRVAHVDGKTPDDERDRIMADLSAGNIDVLCNCLVATEGLDVPEVSCIVLARPTKSLGLYIQMGGRGLRPAPDKADCLILDHSGAVHQHGFLEDPKPWSLDSSDTVQERQERQKSPDEPQPVTCGNCDTVFQGVKECPVCGWQPAAKREGVEVADGDLGEVDQASRKAKDREWTQADKQRWFSMLLHYAQRKGYKPGWAWRKYKEKVGSPPADGLDSTPVPPDDQVSRWIKSRQIAYAKGKAKGASK